MIIPCPRCLEPDTVEELSPGHALCTSCWKFRYETIGDLVYIVIGELQSVKPKSEFFRG